MFLSNTLCPKHFLRHILRWSTHLFLFTNVHDFGEDLGVGELAVPEHGASGLDGFDDLLAVVAGQGEAGRVRVNFHGPPESLLRAVRHAVRLVQDDDFVSAGGQGNLLLGEHFDLVAHHVDASVVGRVQLQDSVFEGGAEQNSRQTEDGCCFTHTGGTLN